MQLAEPVTDCPDGDTDPVPHLMASPTMFTPSGVVRLPVLAFGLKSISARRCTCLSERVLGLVRCGKISKIIGQRRAKT